MTMIRAPRFTGLNPASVAASRAARGASQKRDTAPELLLRRALRSLGLHGYRCDVRSLPGNPDVVFSRARVVVFCDGDFWHGRDLAQRLHRLERGHNAKYWVAKIQGNVARDRRHDAMLENDGWLVLRFWEGELKKQAHDAAEKVRDAVAARSRQS